MKFCRNCMLGKNLESEIKNLNIWSLPKCVSCTDISEFCLGTVLKVSSVEGIVVGVQTKVFTHHGIIDCIPERVVSNFSKFHILVVFTYNISLLDGAENANRTYEWTNMRLWGPVGYSKGWEGVKNRHFLNKVLSDVKFVRFETDPLVALLSFLLFWRGLTFARLWCKSSWWYCLQRFKIMR